MLILISSFIHDSIFTIFLHHYILQKNFVINFSGTCFKEKVKVFLKQIGMTIE